MFSHHFKKWCFYPEKGSKIYFTDCMNLSFLEMFYLNTIEQVFLFVEQLSSLSTLQQTSNWNTNTGGIPKFKVEFK